MPGPRSWAGGAGRRRCGTLTGMADVKEAREALSDVELEPLDPYWRAANYLSVGQIHLRDNPLLSGPPRRPNKPQACSATGARRRARTSSTRT